MIKNVIFILLDLEMSFLCKLGAIVAVSCSPDKIRCKTVADNAGINRFTAMHDEVLLNVLRCQLTY